MTEVKYSPGPWTAHTLMVVNEAGETVVHTGISNTFRPPRPEECVANAQLIAAAPELLEALREAVTELWSLPYGSALVLRMARAAIDKAEGRP